MYRKLLSHNLSIVWMIIILLRNFCLESPQMLCAKFRGNWCNYLGGQRKSRFVTFCKFVKNNGKQKWAWPISHDSAQISEPVDTRSLNM